MRARVHLAARWGGVLLVLAFAVPALGACLPPPPPPTYQSQYCAPVTPSTPGAYQSAFDNMRLAGVEWAAADGGHPTKLPDGRVVWLYGDTFTGQIQGDGSLAPGWRLPRNSFVLQNGACFQPLMGGVANDRTDFIAAPPGQWYWPTAGVVEPTGGGNVLRVFLDRMTSGGGSGLFNFRLLDMQIATFTLPGLQLVDVRPLPNGIASGQSNEWGASALVDGSTIYVYANGPGNQPSQDCDPGRERRVARVPLGSLTTGPWQFFDGANWAGDPSAAAPLQFVADTPLPATACTAKPFDTLRAVRSPNGGYAAGGKLGELGSDPNDALFATEISEWTAQAPQGPWHYRGKIGETPSWPNGDNQFSYGADLLFNLPGGAPTLLYSVNSFNNVAQNIWLYGVKLFAPSALF